MAIWGSLIITSGALFALGRQWVRDLCGFLDLDDAGVRRRGIFWLGDREHEIERYTRWKYVQCGH